MTLDGDIRPVKRVGDRCDGYGSKRATEGNIRNVNARSEDPIWCCLTYIHAAQTYYKL